MPDGTTETISPELLEILVCPVDHGELELEESQLRCMVCGRTYKIENGIPHMLVTDE